MKLTVDYLRCDNKACNKQVPLAEIDSEWIQTADLNVMPSRPTYFDKPIFKTLVARDTVLHFHSRACFVDWFDDKVHQLKADIVAALI